MMTKAADIADVIKAFNALAILIRGSSHPDRWQKGANHH